MNKSELVDRIAANKDIASRAAAQSVLEDVLTAITSALKSGESVTITGFGTFDVADRPERDARNPRTGQTVRVAASKAVKFRPGKALKDAVN